MCANTFFLLGWHVQGEKGRINVLPWCRLVGVAITSSETQRRKNRAAARVSGRHVVRGTDRVHLSWKCAQVTGNAGENVQHSGEVGGSLDKTVGSRVW